MSATGPLAGASLAARGTALHSALWWVGVLLLLALPPWLLPEFQVTLLNYIGMATLVALGLVVITGVAGIVSFGQQAFVGVAAYATAALTVLAGGSPWLGLAASLALVAAVAALIGWVTLRLSGHYLAIATIAWGIAIYHLFGNLPQLGQYSGIDNVPPVSLAGWVFDSGRKSYLLIWVCVLGALAAARNLLDSRSGRAIRALRFRSAMAESCGVDTAALKQVVFVQAAVLAGLAGWLHAHFLRFVSPHAFGVNAGIDYLFMAVIGGASHVSGAVVGAAIMTVSKEWLKDLLPKLFQQTGNYETIVFGVLMILLLRYAREGLVPALARWWPLRAQRTLPALDAPPMPAGRHPREGGDPERSSGAGRKSWVPASAGMTNSKLARWWPLRAQRTQPALDAPPIPRRERPAPGTPLLEVSGVVKRFGGLVAVKELSFDLRAGEILGLIGPNGAGKSTLFNLVSGALPASAGRVSLLGERIDGRPSRDIARRGLARSFQHVHLVSRMSVLDNVALGAHLRGGKGTLAAMLRSDRAEEARLLAEAARQIERVGLSAAMHDPAGTLPLGRQRLVEIARALAADPLLLLLDEPAAGLRYNEKRALAQLLQRLREEGVTILLVEHDMEFVMGLVDRLVVMDFGEKIAEGLPHEIQRHPAVIEAYLGGVE